MSKLAITRYYVPSEDDRRATRKKIEIVRQRLRLIIDLREKLERFEDVSGEDFKATLVRYERAINEQAWDAFVEDYNRLYEELPAIASRLEAALTKAKSQRLRLQLAAQTMSYDAATSEERRALADIFQSAPHLPASQLDAVQARLANLVTKRLLTPPSAATPQATPGQIALARALIGDAFPEPERIADVTAAANTRSAHALVDSNDDRFDLERVGRLVAHLAALDEDVAGYVDRARSLGAVLDPAQRALQIDSLTLEVAERVSAQRRRRDLDQLVGAALAELAPFANAHAATLRSSLEAADQSDDTEAVRTQVDTVHAWTREEAARSDALKARTALIQGLKVLGYEVRLQDDEPWGEGQRVTARRPDEPNYDIQLSAAPNGKVQSKVQAYAHAGRSAGVNQRDVEVEKSWCADLRKLHERLLAQGVACELEQEEEPGSKIQTPIARTGVSDRSEAPSKDQTISRQ